MKIFKDSLIHITEECEKKSHRIRKIGIKERTELKNTAETQSMKGYLFKHQSTVNSQQSFVSIKNNYTFQKYTCEDSIVQNLRYPPLRFVPDWFGDEYFTINKCSTVIQTEPGSSLINVKMTPLAVESHRRAHMSVNPPKRRLFDSDNFEIEGKNDISGVKVEKENVSIDLSSAMTVHFEQREGHIEKAAKPPLLIGSTVKYKRNGRLYTIKKRIAKKEGCACKIVDEKGKMFKALESQLEAVE